MRTTRLFLAEGRPMATGTTSDDIHTNAVICTALGGPEVLSLQPRPVETPRDGQLQVEVRAAGVDWTDLSARMGLHPEAPSPPFVPGLEVAGVVTAVGAAVKDYAIGDRVMGLVRFGGYSEVLNIDVLRCRHLPDGWTFEEGATFTLPALTCLYGIRELGRLRRGELLVVGASDPGVSSYACRLAHASGARVVVLVDEDWKLQETKALGADLCVNIHRGDLGRQIRNANKNDGVDLVFEDWGGEVSKRSYALLEPHGRLVSYGTRLWQESGERPDWLKLGQKWVRRFRADPTELIASCRSINGFNLLAIWDRLDVLSGLWDEALVLAETHGVRPTLDRSFALSDWDDAHAWLRSGEARGRLALLSGDQGQPPTEETRRPAPRPKDFLDDDPGIDGPPQRGRDRRKSARREQRRA